MFHDMNIYIMKYLKTYKTFEAVIIPQKIESDLFINSFDDLAITQSGYFASPL